MGRPLIVAVGVLAVAAMVWAGVVERDSFPLSDYPMFAGDRPTVASFDTVVAIGPGGQVRRLSPEEIGGTDQVIQAAATVSRAIRGSEADRLCEEILVRIGGSAALEVVTERYDTHAWFDGDETPVERIVHADCAR